jgi:transposase
MNLQIHHVISDITGITGLRIIEAVLAGERDPAALAGLRDGRIKASEETIIKSLVGDYRREHLFTLGQSLAAWRNYQKLMTECDREIEEQLQAFASAVDVQEKPLTPSKVPGRSRYTNEPSFDLRGQLYRVFGVDLTAVPGISTLTAHTLLAEIGPDLSQFRSAAAFSSWLGLCPDNDISGGRKLLVKTRAVNNRASCALRMAVNGLHKSQTWLGNFFRRMRAKLGAPKAVTATAHKLARIVYQLLSTRQPYDESVFAYMEQTNLLRREGKLKAQAKALGFDIVPTQTKRPSIIVP